MRDNLTRTQVVLTKRLQEALQKEAWKKCGGNRSMLMKLILAERYKMPSEIPEAFR